jgi:AcrR family transcriptional regulator
MKVRKNRRDEIRSIALELFSVAGYEGTSISDIAARLDISKAAISYHFASKDDLLVSLVEPLLDELEGVIAAHPDPDWPDGVRALAGDYFDALVADQRLAVWVDTDRAVLSHPALGRRRRKVQDALVHAVTGPGADPADVVRATAFVGGLLRPLRRLPAADLIANRAALLDAALVSYAPLPDD